MNLSKWGHLLNKRITSLRRWNWLIGTGLILWLSACRSPKTELLPLTTPTHWVSAKTVLLLYEGPLGANIPLDTLTITGKTYYVSSIDSTRFTYDQQDRLLRLEIQKTSQGSAYPTMKFPPYQYKSQSTFTYQNRRLTELNEEGINLKPVIGLDSDLRRIEFKQTRNSLGALQLVETLRTYSPEGILSYRRRTLYTAGLKPLVDEEHSTVKDGNVVQTILMSLESYGPANKVYETTDYEYDLNRVGAPAMYTFEGETSRNALLKKTLTRTYLSSVDRYEFTYSNEYDAQGRLVAQVEYLRTNNAPDREIKYLTRYYY